MAAGAKRFLIYLFMGLVSIAVTYVVAVLIVPGDRQTDKFWLSLGALVSAQALWLLHRLVVSVRGKVSAAARQARNGIRLTLLVYGVGVVSLAAIALSAISFRWLLALHLVWMLVPCVAFGSFLLAELALSKTIHSSQGQQDN